MINASLMSAFFSELEKIAKTRSVAEWQAAHAAGDQATAGQIAQASGQLGLAPRHVRDVSEGGMEAGVDLMMGKAPGGPAAAAPGNLQSRLQDYKARKSSLGLGEKRPSQGVLQSGAARSALGVSAPPSAAAPVAGQNADGLMVRKLYKPDSPMHRAEFTPQVLQQKQEFTDAARSISPEAKAMVPAMYGHQALHVDKGPELQRAVSYHEYIPQMKEVGDMSHGEVAQMKNQTQKTLLDPMKQKKMELRDLISRKGDVNPGNLVQTPTGPKAIDFMPGDFRPGGASPMSSSMKKYNPGEASVFHEKAHIPALRKEVFNPSLRVSPQGLLGKIPESPLNRALHPGSFSALESLGSRGKGLLNAAAHHV